jgi:hypothetical protein
MIDQIFQNWTSLFPSGWFGFVFTWLLIHAILSTLFDRFV